MDETIEQRVGAVIAESGLAKSDFAAAIGLDASKLSKSLSGRRRFSSLELARVAEVGHRSVDWLITGRPPFRPVLAQRARTAGVEDSAGGQVVERIVSAVRGLRELGRPFALPTLPRLETRSSWYTVEASRLAASYVASIDQPLGGCSTSQIISAVERQFGIVVLIAELPDGIDGLSYEDGDARVIVLAPTNQPLRQRFTLAHEVAHIAFGDALQGVLEERMWETKTKEEKRANSFAAAFLAPAHEINIVLDGRAAADVFPLLVEHFQLSPDAMAWRLLNEKFIDDRTCQQLRGVGARSVYMKLGKPAEYVELSMASQEPRPAWPIVNAYVDAYRSGDTTAKPVAKLLGWGVEDVEEFFALEDVEARGAKSEPREI